MINWGWDMRCEWTKSREILREVVARITEISIKVTNEVLTGDEDVVDS